MKPTTSRNQVHQFIGVVNYYCYMWERHSHRLAPLTHTASSKVKFKWNKIKQDDFTEIKQIVYHDTLLAYKDFK